MRHAIEYKYCIDMTSVQSICCVLYFTSQMYGMESLINTTTTNSVGHACEQGLLTLAQLHGQMQTKCIH